MQFHTGYLPKQGQAYKKKKTVNGYSVLNLFKSCHTITSNNVSIKNLKNVKRCSKYKRYCNPPNRGRPKYSLQNPKFLPRQKFLF